MDLVLGTETFGEAIEQEIAYLKDKTPDHKRNYEQSLEDGRDGGYNVHIRRPFETEGGRITNWQRSGPEDDLVNPEAPLEEPGFNENLLLLSLENLLQERHEEQISNDWVIASDHHHTVNLHPEPPDANGESDPFVVDLDISQALELFGDSILNHSSTVQGEEAGQILAEAYCQTIQTNHEEKMAGKTKGKKTSTRNKKGRSTTNSKSDRDLIGYMNPFPDLNARIPDGKLISSLPHRYVNVGEFRVPEITMGHILMWPGLDAGALFFTTDPSGTNINPASVGYWRFTGQESYINGSTVAGPLNSTPLNNINGETIYQIEGDVNRWRLVSQGMRMSLTNPDDSNGGWFETCHLHYKLNLEDWEIYAEKGTHTLKEDGTSTSTISGTDAYIRPKPTILSELIPFTASLAEIDGYRLGTLKSIAATAFTLPVFQGQHDLQNLDVNYRIEAGGIQWDSVPGTTLDPATYNFRPGLNECKDLVEACMDQSHDLIYIKIHPGGVVTGDNQSSFLVQMCTNHEVVYDADATLHKHMLPAPNKHGKYEKARDDKDSDKMQGVTKLV